MDYNLKPIWNALIDIYVEFEKICKRHGLRYYVAYGTVLGAVRHHGFIPWDDDFDVAMPRPDYEALIALPKEEFPAWLRLDSLKTNSDYSRQFSKICDMRRDVVEGVQKETGFPLAQGLFIDIFAIDGIGKKKPSSFFFKIRRTLQWSLGVYLANDHTLRHFPLYLTGMILHWMHPDVRSLRDVAFYMDKRAQLHGYSDDEWCAYYFDTIPRFYAPNTFGDGVWLSFDGIQVPVPSQYEQYLRTKYGDYMKLPPESERKPNHQRTMWAKQE